MMRDWRSWQAATLEDEGLEFRKDCRCLTSDLESEGIQSKLFGIDGPFAPDLYEIFSFAHFVPQHLSGVRLSHLVSQTLTLCESQPDLADFLLILGVPARALSIYLSQPSGARWLQGSAIASALLGEDRSSLEYFSQAVDLASTDRERAAIGYNLGQQLFWMGRRHEALGQFGRCRRLLPFYRHTARWLEALHWLLNHPTDPIRGPISMPVPRERRLLLISSPRWA